MLSYQHAYHAGNFADVIKHLTLVQLLQYLCKKDKPFFYLETHAGRGLYDLKSYEAQKNQEASCGIETVFAQQAKIDKVFIPYIDGIKKCNLPNKLRYYPGSPTLALQQMRPQDRLFGCELHPGEFLQLQKIKQRSWQSKLFFAQTDGLQQLSVLLPPPERRGLIFIDPSYEIKSDYLLVPAVVAKAYQRFSGGMFCIWYPVLNHQWHLKMLSKLATLGNKHLHVEFQLEKYAREGMNGCGVWIINPPYTLAHSLRSALRWLTTCLNPGVSTYLVKEHS
jgi:23S rRNA (adenine2030-N6)-methyltransferase